MVFVEAHVAAYEAVLLTNPLFLWNLQSQKRKRKSSTGLIIHPSLLEGVFFFQMLICLLRDILIFSPTFFSQLKLFLFLLLTVVILSYPASVVLFFRTLQIRQNARAILTGYKHKTSLKDLYIKCLFTFIVITLTEMLCDFKPAVIEGFDLNSKQQQTLLRQLT